MSQFGKFSSAEELLKGYNQLEKSFTQKCQQLSQLQKEALQKADEDMGHTTDAVQQTVQVPRQEQSSTNIDGTNAEASPSTGEEAHSTTVESVDTVPENQRNDATVDFSDPAPTSQIPSDEALQQYLKDHPDVAYRLLQQRTEEFAPNVMVGGGNVSLALPSRPKSIKEASLMAKELFK